MIHEMSVAEWAPDLYLFTCSECGYSYKVTLVDGVHDMANKEIIVEGDLTAQHSWGLGGLSIVGVEVD